MAGRAGLIFFVTFFASTCPEKSGGKKVNRVYPSSDKPLPTNYLILLNNVFSDRQAEILRLRKQAYFTCLQFISQYCISVIFAA